MRKVANDHTATVTTGRSKSSPSVMGGQSALNLTRVKEGCLEEVT